MTTHAAQCPWILDDPSRMLEQIITEGRGRIGDTLVAAVGRNSRALLGVRKIATPEPRPRACYDLAPNHDMDPFLEAVGESGSTGDPDLDLTRLLESIGKELLQNIPLTSDADSHVIADLFTVVCRDGYVVTTATETQFIRAWRRTHIGQASDADVYVVTPYGWIGFMDRRCGLHPAVAGRPSLRLLTE